MPPPSGIRLSCMALTPPSDAPVVLATQTAVDGAPKRTSLPSMFTWVEAWTAAMAGAGWVSDP